MKCLKGGIAFLLSDLFKSDLFSYICVCTCKCRWWKTWASYCTFLLQRVIQAGRLWTSALSLKMNDSVKFWGFTVGRIIHSASKTDLLCFPVVPGVTQLPSRVWIDTPNKSCSKKCLENRIPSPPCILSHAFISNLKIQWLFFYLNIDGPTECPLVVCWQNMGHTQTRESVSGIYFTQNEVIHFHNRNEGIKP